MKAKKWTPEQKFQIVIEGLKNQEKVADLCARYGVAQSQYYKWRDQFIENGTKAFEPQPDKQLMYAKAENQRLKSIIGDLTIELKKTASNSYSKRSAIY